MAIETTTGERFFADYVELFNAGVRTGDFGPMVARYAADATFEVQGVPLGQIVGRDAIDAIYRAQPPDDEINLLRVDESPDGSLTGR